MTTQRNVWLNRNTKQVIYDASTGRMHKRYPADFPTDTGVPASNANWVFAPDLSAVEGQPTKYWVLTGDTVSLADQATRDAIDAAELEAARDGITAQLDQQEDLMRAFAGLVMDELNDRSATISQLLDAIDGASNLQSLKDAVASINNPPQRTLAQFKTAMRNKLGT